MSMSKCCRTMSYCHLLLALPLHQFPLQKDDCQYAAVDDFNVPWKVKVKRHQVHWRLMCSALDKAPVCDELEMRMFCVTLHLSFTRIRPTSTRHCDFLISHAHTKTLPSCKFLLHSNAFTQLSQKWNMGAPFIHQSFHESAHFVKRFPHTIWSVLCKEYMHYVSMCLYSILSNKP